MNDPSDANKEPAKIHMTPTWLYLPDGSSEQRKAFDDWLDSFLTLGGILTHERREPLTQKERDELYAERQGIFAWMVKGAAKNYQKRGNNPPAPPPGSGLEWRRD